MRFLVALGLTALAAGRPLVRKVLEENGEVEISSAELATLTNVDMSDWDEDRKANFVAALPRDNPEQWWTRLSDQVYGPGAAVAMGQDLEEDDSNQGVPSDYMYYLGDSAGLPEQLKPLEVAGIQHAAVFIIRRPHGEEANLEDFEEDARTLSNGESLLVKVPSSPQNRSLEEDVNPPFDLNFASITPETYEATLRGFLEASQDPDEKHNPQHLEQRYVGTTGHNLAQSYLIEELKKIPDIRIAKQGYHNGGRNLPGGFDGTNVIGCLPGKSRDFISVGGHTDTLPSDVSERDLEEEGGAASVPSPGAMDDGSGVAAALQTIQFLASARKNGEQLACTVCATFFDGEEHGLTGSHVVANYIAEHQRNAISLEEEDLDELNKTPQMGRFLGAIVSDMSTGFKAETQPGGLEEQLLHVPEPLYTTGLAVAHAAEPVVQSTIEMIKAAFNLEEEGEEAGKESPAEEGDLEEADGDFDLERDLDDVTKNMRDLEEDSEEDEDDEDRDAGWRADSNNVKLSQGVQANTNNEGVHIDGNGQNMGFFNAFVEAGKSKDISGEVYESSAAIWNSDHKSFYAAGLPAVDICAANHRMYAYWHHQDDKLAALDFTTGPEVVKTMVGGIYNLMKPYSEAQQPANVPYTLADQLNKAELTQGTGSATPAQAQGWKRLEEASDAAEDEDEDAAAEDEDEDAAAEDEDEDAADENAVDEAGDEAQDEAPELEEDEDEPDPGEASANDEDGE